MIFQQQPDVSYKFIKESSEVGGMCSEPATKIKISLQGEVPLETLLEYFRDFLIVSGFVLTENESVAIIRENTEERNNEDESDTEI